eukprot:COSAG01_NODE_35437_length_531_cov_18.530093_1_plen_20_part_01
MFRDIEGSKLHQKYVGALES